MSWTIGGRIAMSTGPDRSLIAADADHGRFTHGAVNAIAYRVARQPKIGATSKLVLSDQRATAVDSRPVARSRIVATPSRRCRSLFRWLI